MSVSRARPPGWAVLCTIVGSLLMVISGSLVVTGEWLLARYDVRQQDLLGPGDGEGYGDGLAGPLNILLAGLDTRPHRPDEPPRADAIMVVHVPAGVDRAYLISLPRDLLVDIPPLPDVGYHGATDRLNAAMYVGSLPVGEGQGPDVRRGFSLLAQTVSDLTGIRHWDAGLVVTFEGVVDVVDALGGISLELAEPVVSLHRQPDGTHRPLNPDGDGYHGPRMVYEPGTPPCDQQPAAEGPFRCELNGWQALDIARQRYGVAGGDFGRQHNQQRILQAIVDRAFSREMVTDPVALDRLMRAAGDAMIFDGRGHSAVDFAFALRDVRPGTLRMVGLPSTGVGSGDDYQGEQLEPAGRELFTALRTGRLEEYLATHPDLVR